MTWRDVELWSGHGEWQGPIAYSTAADDSDRSVAGRAAIVRYLTEYLETGGIEGVYLADPDAFEPGDYPGVEDAGPTVDEIDWSGFPPDDRDVECPTCDEVDCVRWAHRDPEAFAREAATNVLDRWEHMEPLDVGQIRVAAISELDGWDLTHLRSAVVDRYLELVREGCEREGLILRTGVL